MPLNRFSTVGQSEYTPQHVPLPFEAIAALGERTQKDYDKSLKDLEVTDPIAKLNPRTAIKVYNPNSPEGISDASLDWTSQRDQAVNSLNAEKNKITDDYIQSGDTETFKKKSREYINKAAQIHSNLSAKEAVAKQVNDYNKELAKNKDFALQGHLGQKLLDYNTQFFKDAAEGNIRDYNPYDVASPTDRPKEVKEYFNSMGKEILQSFSDPTNTGYIRTKYREGLSGNKISNVFNSWYQNSKVQDDIRLEALDLAARKGIDTKAEVTVKVPVSKNAKTGEITYKEEKMPWIDAYEEQALNQVKDIALGFKSSSGKDDLSGDESYWKKRKEEDEKLAQIASTTPETLTLRDNGSLKTMMPEGLSKFYDNNDINLSNNVQAGSKQQGDEVAKMGGWINLELGDSKKSNDLQKNAIEYTNQLFENASKILGISKKEVAERYKKEDNGYKWLKGTVENHYQNLTLEKNNVATLQAPEQIAATNFFLGGNPSEKESPDAIAPNIRNAELTDLQGNRIDNKKGINSNNYNVSSIGFDKPGQIVLSGSNGTQLLMNTNYPTFNKVTQPMVDINNGATNYLKTFELNKDQKSRLGIADNISNKAPEFSTILNDQPIKGEAIDWHKYKLNNKQYDVITFNTRAITGNPEIYVNYKVKDNNGNVIDMKTLSLDQYKILTANSIIQSPEFRSINKEHENKVEFNTK